MEGLDMAMVCYPTYGGSGVMATELGKSLARRGHRIHFISYSSPARIESMRGEGLTIHPVEVISYPLFKFPPYTLALASKIMEVVEKYKLKIIHVHYTIPHTMAAYLALHILGNTSTKIITTLHGTDINLIGMDPSYKEITNFGLRISHGLTAVSQYLAEVTQRSFASSGQSIKVIHNFVEVDKFIKNPSPQARERYAQAGEKIITHVSNFRMVKRIPDVLETFQRIHQKIPSVLLMVGDGPERDTAITLSREMGLSAKVFFLDFVKPVQDILSISDVLLLPSENESFGLSALEAMSCEVPVVAYRVGGLPEVVEDRRCGFLVDKGDIEAMAYFALLVLEDQELSRSMGERGRYLAVSKFSEQEKVSEYERYYHQIINQDRGQDFSQPCQP